MKIFWVKVKIYKLTIKTLAMKKVIFFYSF